MRDSICMFARKGKHERVKKVVCRGRLRHIGPFVNVAKSIEIWVKSEDFTHGPV